MCQYLKESAGDDFAAIAIDAADADGFVFGFGIIGDCIGKGFAQNSFSGRIPRVFLLLDREVDPIEDADGTAFGFVLNRAGAGEDSGESVVVASGDWIKFVLVASGAA